MMTPKALNIIGLILGMIGVAIIFGWGPPQPNFDTDAHLLIEDETTEQAAQEVIVLKQFYSIMSSVGLGFVLVGFGFQLIGTLVSPGPIIRKKHGDTFNGEHGNEREAISTTSPNISKHNDENSDKGANYTNNHHGVRQPEDWCI